MDKHFTEDGLLKSPSLIHCVVYHSTLIEHDRIKQKISTRTVEDVRQQK